MVYIMPASFTESQEVRIERNTRDHSVQIPLLASRTLQVQKGKRMLESAQLVSSQANPRSQAPSAQVFPAPFSICLQLSFLKTPTCMVSYSPDPAAHLTPGLEHCFRPISIIPIHRDDFCQMHEPPVLLFI